MTIVTTINDNRHHNFNLLPIVNFGLIVQPMVIHPSLCYQQSMRVALKNITSHYMMYHMMSYYIISSHIAHYLTISPAQLDVLPASELLANRRDTPLATSPSYYPGQCPVDIIIWISLMSIIPPWI